MDQFTPQKKADQMYTYWAAILLHSRHYRIPVLPYILNISLKFQNKGGDILDWLLFQPGPGRELSLLTIPASCLFLQAAGSYPPHQRELLVAQGLLSYCWKLLLCQRTEISCPRGDKDTPQIAYWKGIQPDLGFRSRKAESYSSSFGVLDGRSW